MSELKCKTIKWVNGKVMVDLQAYCKCRDCQNHPRCFGLSIAKMEGIKNGDIIS